MPRQGSVIIIFHLWLCSIKINSPAYRRAQHLIIINEISLVSAYGHQYIVRDKWRYTNCLRIRRAHGIYESKYRAVAGVMSSAGGRGAPAVGKRRQEKAAHRGGVMTMPAVSDHGGGGERRRASSEIIEICMGARFSQGVDRIMHRAIVKIRHACLMVSPDPDERR